MTGSYFDDSPPIERVGFLENVPDMPNFCGRLVETVFLEYRQY